MYSQGLMAKNMEPQALPRFELGLPESESEVLTTTLQGLKQWVSRGSNPGPQPCESCVITNYTTNPDSSKGGTRELNPGPLAP